MVERGDEETKNCTKITSCPRKNLPGNIRVTRTRTIGPQKGRTRKKKVQFAWQIHLLRTGQEE